MIDTARPPIREPQSVAHLSRRFSRSAFQEGEVLADSASLDVVLGALMVAEQVFIEWCGAVAAVITRHDLQKPPLRMPLIGDCLQVKDKADILRGDSASLATLGIQSRREAERLTRDLEMIRNHLAHAQQVEAEHLATAGTLAAFIHPSLRAEGVPRITAWCREMAAPDLSNTVAS